MPKGFGVKELGIVSCCVGVLLLSSVFGWAQLTTTGTIAGTVTDTSRAVVPGAEVTIINEGTHV
jgi:hypothetical protein